MMEVKISINGVHEIQKTLQNIDKNLIPVIVAEATHDVYDNVKNRAHKHHVTGNMEDNISLKVHKESGEVFIEDNAMMVKWRGKKVNYASFVLYGTRPHTIEPKEKKTLRYSGVKDFVFAKAVEHKGYKGDNFLYDGVKDTFKKLDNIIDKAVRYGIE